jgi:hypothetical protein
VTRSAELARLARLVRINRRIIAINAIRFYLIRISTLEDRPIDKSTLVD